MKNDNAIILDYYREMESKAVFVDSCAHILKIFKGSKKQRIVVTKSRYIRKLASLLRIKTILRKKAQIAAEQYFAMKDALLFLAKKGVPVYYYNRVGLEKSGFQYSDSALIRMKKKLNFPSMLENIDLYDDQLRDVFRDLYDKDYIMQLGKIPQVIEKGDIYCHEDFISKYVNVIAGKRIVCSSPKEYKRTLHIYGRCGAFGYAVEDKNSLPSQIQQQLIEKGITDIRVINHGLWGGQDEYLIHNFLNDCIGYKEGDIVLFYMKHINKNLLKHWEDRGVYYKEITHEWHAYPEAQWCFFDKPGHMNHVGYRNVAEIVVNDLIHRAFRCIPVKDELFDSFKSDYLTSYLKQNNTSKFYTEINEYTQSILRQFPIKDESMICGSIVMNCNPFTKGHRYLIEYASKQVDRLYIFVVNEDKSFFKFEDRFEMVKEGTSDIGNVVVVPSGKFIISSLTFPEYFMKDYVKEKNFDVSLDVETFCKHIAPPLCIKKRYVGEEPFDPVTENYSESMRRILPQYGMEFYEIPRLALDESRVINATRVRQLLKEKDYTELEEYVPQSTYRILVDKYSR